MSQKFISQITQNRVSVIKDIQQTIDVHMVLDGGCAIRQHCSFLWEFNTPSFFRRLIQGISSSSLLWKQNDSSVVM